MEKIVTKNGMWIERTDALEWKIGNIDGRAISTIQGVEAWKVWSLLAYQEPNVRNREKGSLEFQTFQEYMQYKRSLPRSSEALRIFNANCHGTRQYLERDDEDRIDVKYDPILPARDGWGEYWIEQSYEKALDRFQAPFTFGFAHHLQEDGTPAVYHSGRVLSREGICFDKSGAGVDGIFALKSIEELRATYGDRLIFTQQFPRRETPWKRETRLPTRKEDAQRLIEYNLFRREERLYVAKLRARMDNWEFGNRTSPSDQDVDEPSSEQ